MSRVSIILRTKDRPRMLARAIDDILAQSLSDWQIVIVNDGGDGRSVAEVVASRSEQLMDRHQVVTSELSLGGPGASNLGLRHAQGEYVVVHDDDDLWHPDFLARTVAHLDQAPESLAVVAPTEIVVEELQGDTFVEVDRRPFFPPGGVVSLVDLIVINRVVPISMLVRRSAFTAVGNWDETLLVVDDWEFHLRLAMAGQIDYLEGEPLAFWMQRPSVTDGAVANSMFASPDAHYKFDRLVRERALRPGGPHHDLGQLLYLSKFIDERVRNAENRINARIHAEAEYYSLGATVRRALRRMKPYGRGRQSVKP